MDRKSKSHSQAFQNDNSLVEGSRCSSFRNWQMRSDISKNAAGAWILTPSAANEVKGVTDLTPLGDHP